MHLALFYYNMYTVFQARIYNLLVQKKCKQSKQTVHAVYLYYWVIAGVQRIIIRKLSLRTKYCSLQKFDYKAILYNLNFNYTPTCIQRQSYRFMSQRHVSADILLVSYNIKYSVKLQNRNNYDRVCVSYSLFSNIFVQRTVMSLGTTELR